MKKGGKVVIKPTNFGVWRVDGFKKTHLCIFLHYGILGFAWFFCLFGLGFALGFAFLVRHQSRQCSTYFSSPVHVCIFGKLPARVVGVPRERAQRASSKVLSSKVEILIGGTPTVNFTRCEN